MLLKNNFKSAVPVLLLFLCLPVSSWAQITLADCDGDFVTMPPDELIIDVAPTGIDDTANIQCALDVAAITGIPIVRLSRDDFVISSLFIERFNGSFQGTTRTSTRLVVVDGSIDCAAMESQGLTPAAVKFSQGEPSLKFMQVVALSPCMSGAPLNNLIHFTGKNANDPGCGFSVINGRVDRVDVVGPGRGGDINVAIAATAEGEFLGGCNDALLGGFKLNKSTVTGFTVGLQTGMRSGAQVDVNFTKFMQDAFGIVLLNSNQSTTVTTNEFFSDDSGPFVRDCEHILVTTTIAGAPAKTRLVIDNNKFYIDAQKILQADAIRVATFDGGTQTVSLSITNNDFTLAGTSIAGIWGEDVDNAAISANNFKGWGRAGIVLTVNERPSVSGSTITANKGFATFNGNTADIEIRTGVMQTIVGPGQAATVNDSGTGSVILSETPVGNDASLQWKSNSNTLKVGIGSAGGRANAAKESLARLVKLLRKN